jgi:putative ABC transport system permease protein
VKAPDLLELALRNLREARLRNALTTLGIAVGVASLVAMLSLGVGLQELVGQRLDRSGLFDSIVVYPRRDGRGFERADARADGENESLRLLTPEIRRQMESLPNVAEVFPEVRFSTQVRWQDTTRFTSVAGLPFSARSNEAFDDMLGHFFSSPEAEEAILELDFAQELTPQPESLLGQTVVLRYAERQPLGTDGNADQWGFTVQRREKMLRVVGIVRRQPFGGWRNFARGELFIPTALAERLNTLQFSTVREAVRAETTEETYGSLIVRVSNPARVREVQQAIRQMGLATYSILDAAESLRRFFIIVDLFLGIFGSLALAVASLGIVNTLVMAILERRREIGIMKALGASDGDVKRLFFAEAGVMGLLGGLVGVLLAAGIGAAINFGTGYYLQRQDLPPESVSSLPFWLGSSAIVFSILVSLVAGIYPAARAARLDPVEALRYE